MAFLPAMAVAQEIEFPAVIVDSSTDACPLGDSRVIPFGELPDPAGDEPPCVTVEGLWARTHLFEGVEGFYRASSFAPRDGPAEGVLGVYGWRNRVAVPDRLIPARLSGALRDCGEAEASGFSWDGVGYCSPQSSMGPYIALGEVQLMGPTPERLTGPEHRRRLGQLIELRRDSPLIAALEAKAFAWRDALRTGDPLSYLTAYEPDGIWSGELASDIRADPESELHDILARSDTVFRRLVAEHHPELRIWLVPLDVGSVSGPADPRDYQAIACFKLGIWSDDRWPVGMADADNADGRPYTCVGMWRSTTEGEVEERVYAWGAATYGLAEPRWPD